MAKDTIEIDIKVDDKGTTQKQTLNSKKAGQQFDDTTKKADKYHKGQKGVAQATANSTKAFSKMQGGMTGMVGVYAEIASRVFALSAAFMFLKNASDVTNLIAGQEAMGSATGVAYKSLTADLKAATDGQLAYADAARAAAIGTAAGLSASQLTEIGTAARNVSNALGRDLRDSFERLTRGITKAEPELLDELGIILRLETAKKNYASQIGKTAQSLTQFEQSQAIANEVLTQAEEKFGKIEELMDPSAASLNKFLTSFDDLMNSLKIGTMSVLRPVFDFLSENTMALVSTLGFLGLSIAKSILPNMTEWRASSKLAAESAATDLANYRTQVTASKVALQDFMKTQQASKASAVGIAGGVVGDFGTTTKGGGGAMDFLSGSSDTKRARNNARKVLQKAQAEYDKFGKVTTGMLKGYNSKQLADLQRSFKMREAILDGTKVKHKLTLEQMKMHWNVWAANAQTKLAGIKATMADFGAWASKWGSRLMGAFGWIGLISLGVTFIKGFIDKALPDHLKKLNKEAKEFTGNLTTLNDELEKMDRVQSTGMLSIQELGSQIGKATASADLHAKVLEFQRMSQAGSTKETEKARKKLLETAKALANLDPRYKTYADNLEKNRNLTEQQLINLKNTSNAMIEQGNAIDNLAKAQQSFNDSIAKANTGVKPLNILQDQLNTAVKLKDTLKLAREGGQSIVDSVMPQEFLTARQGVKDAQQSVVKPSKKGFFEFSASYDPQPMRDYYAAIAEGKTAYKTEEDRAAAIESANVAFEKQKQNLTDGEASLIKLSDRYDDITGLIEIINRKSQKSINISQAQLQIREANKELMNRGITIQERSTNLQIEANKDKIKEGDFAQKVLQAELKLQAALRDKSENAKELVKTATHEQKVANLNLELERKRAQIAKEVRADKKAQLELEKQLNPLIASRNAQEIALLQQQRLKKGTDSGASGFGFSQAALSRQQEAVTLSTKISIAKGKQKELQTKLDKVTAGTIKKSQKETQNLKQQVKLAKEKVLSSQQNLSIHNSAVKIAENNRKAQIEELNFHNEMFSLNPLQKEFNEAILSMKKQGITLSQKEQQVLLQQLQTIKDQKDLLERKEAIAAAVGGNLASVIADALRGNITSLKEGIKQLAQGIMNDIVDIISKQIAQSLLSLIPGNLFTSPSVKMAAAHSAGAAQMTGALTTGATALTTGLATAFTTGAATLSAAIATACAACSVGCEGGGGGGGSSIVDGLFDIMDSFEFFATGGISSNGKKLAGYSTGGVAKGSQKGYPAILHGTEAVVPLPNGKSIPVEMSSNQNTSNVAQTNNISISVSSEGTEVSGEASDQQSENLGRAIAQAVQKELQNQKRSGGILSPYGVA